MSLLQASLSSNPFMGLIGCVTRYAGDNIRVGMGVGFIFPAVLIIMLIIVSQAKDGTKYSIMDASTAT